MRFYSCFADLKVIHSKGTAVFKNGIYETTDKDIIAELKKDKHIQVRKNIEEIMTNVKENSKEKYRRNYDKCKRKFAKITKKGAIMPLI